MNWEHWWVKKLKWWAIMAERPLQVQNMNNLKSHTTGFWGLCDAHHIILNYCERVWLSVPGIQFPPPLSLTLPLITPLAPVTFIHLPLLFLLCSPHLLMWQFLFGRRCDFLAVSGCTISGICLQLEAGLTWSEERGKAGLELLTPYLDLVLHPNCHALSFSL